MRAKNGTVYFIYCILEIREIITNKINKIINKTAFEADPKCEHTAEQQSTYVRATITSYLHAVIIH